MNSHDGRDNMKRYATAKTKVRWRVALKICKGRQDSHDVIK